MYVRNPQFDAIACRLKYNIIKHYYYFLSFLNIINY